MVFVGIGYYYFYFYVFDGISCKMWLMWLCNVVVLMCLMVFVVVMWVGGNLLVLMYMLFMSGVLLLGVVMILVCMCMVLSLFGLIGVGFFQFCMEQFDVLVI